MSSTDMLGHWDVPGLSATKPRPRQWICIPTMPKDVGMLSLPVLVTAPYMSVRGDNTTPLSNDSIAVNFLKKNEITIPRLPPKATESTYGLIDCENKFLNVVLIP